jgi:hypothetical protein
MFIISFPKRKEERIAVEILLLCAQTAIWILNPYFLMRMENRALTNNILGTNYKPGIVCKPYKPASNAYKWPVWWFTSPIGLILGSIQNCPVITVSPVLY